MQYKDHSHSDVWEDSCLNHVDAMRSVTGATGKIMSKVQKSNAILNLKANWTKKESIIDNLKAKGNWVCPNWWLVIYKRFVPLNWLLS